MKKVGLEKETEFFVTGVRTYVDADDAMTEFRRMAQHKCWTVASRRLGDINKALDMRLTPADLHDYDQKTDDHHYIGKQAEVKGLGGLYFCLRLSREDKGSNFDAFVFLYRKRRDIAESLWKRSRALEAVTWKGRNNLGFGQTLPENKIPKFDNYLDGAVTDFLAFINESGGLKKHLAPAS
jgi:hypothetical protein